MWTSSKIYELAPVWCEISSDLIWISSDLLWASSDFLWASFRISLIQLQFDVNQLQIFLSQLWFALRKLQISLIPIILVALWSVCEHIQGLMEPMRNMRRILSNSS